MAIESSSVKKDEEKEGGEEWRETGSPGGGKGKCVVKGKELREICRKISGKGGQEGDE